MPRAAPLCCDELDELDDLDDLDERGHLRHGPGSGSCAHQCAGRLNARGNEQTAQAVATQEKASQPCQTEARTKSEIG